MSSLISGLSNTAFLNNASQRVLSQSNNVSYSARGVYRVSDTDPARKADYWFRDFGMVMACAYMTEFGFKGVDTLFTIPLITEALKLNELSTLKDAEGHLRYPAAINYKTLPDVYRNRVMGSLIRSSSSDLVPKLMKQLELRNAELHPKIKDKITSILNSSSAKVADTEVTQYIAKHSLDLGQIQSISAIENEARRKTELNKLLANHPEGKRQVIKNAVKLEDARQMRILTEHLHVNMNFAEYVKENFLKPKSDMTATVTDVLKDFAEKVTNLRDPEKGSDKLAKTLNEIWYLPPHGREEQFNKKFKEFQDALFLSEGKPLVTEQERLAFAQLGNKYRDLLKADNKAGLQGIAQEFKAFYEGLKDNQDKHVKELYKHFPLELQDKIKKKVADTVKDVIKKDPTQDPTAALTEKLEKLQLNSFLQGKEQEVGSLIGKIKNSLAKDSSNGILKPTMDEIDDHLKEFMGHFPAAENLLNPLLNEAKQGLSEKGLRHLISEGISSRAVLNTISKVQKSSTWPKTFSTVLLNLVFYGFLASNFDNKILQPYQQKLVAERGTSQDIVNAGYLGLIPAFGVLTQLIDQTTLPAMMKMGNFTRFAVVGGAALSTFAGSAYLILQQLLKTPPKNPPQQSALAASNPPKAPALAPVFPAVNNASPFALPGQPVGGFNPSSFAPLNGFQPMANGMPQGLNAPGFGAQAPRVLSRQA